MEKALPVLALTGSLAGRRQLSDHAPVNPLSLEQA